MMYVKVQMRSAETGDTFEAVLSWGLFSRSTMAKLRDFIVPEEHQGTINQVIRSPQYQTVREAKAHQFTARDRVVVGKATGGSKDD